MRSKFSPLLQECWKSLLTQTFALIGELDHLLDAALSEQTEALKAKKTAKTLRKRGVWKEGLKQSKDDNHMLIKDAFEIANKKIELETLKKKLKQKPKIDSILGRYRRSTDGSSGPAAPPQPKPLSAPPSLPKLILNDGNKLKKKG